MVTIEEDPESIRRREIRERKVEQVREAKRVLDERRRLAMTRKKEKNYKSKPVISSSEEDEGVKEPEEKGSEEGSLVISISDDEFMEDRPQDNFIDLLMSD